MPRAKKDGRGDDAAAAVPDAPAPEPKKAGRVRAAADPAAEPVASGPAKKPRRPKKSDRPVVHDSPRYALFLHRDDGGAGEFGSAAAWDQLGCVTEDLGDGSEPLFDNPVDGRPVWCRNNTRNRPLSMRNVLDLKQRILNRQWRFNGEPFVVGRTDEVLSGQHTMVALILADHELTRDDADPHWVRLWRDRNGTVSIPKACCYGIDESDEVVNTLDTGSSRTVGDVLYRTEAFRGLPKELRNRGAKAAATAVKLLWERAGGKTNAWHPLLNQAEATGFVEDHPSLVRAVRHVLEEDAGGRLGALGVGPGTAAGMLYLMAADGDDRELYEKKGETEKGLRLPSWDRAAEFWTLLAGGSPDVSGLTEALKGVALTSLGNRGRYAALVKAWILFRDGKPLSGKAAENKVYPKTVDHGDGPKLADFPSVDGIDLGPADVPDAPAPASGAGKAKAKAAGGNPAGPPPNAPAEMSHADRLGWLRARYGERVLAFPGRDGAFRLWDEDARWTAKLLVRACEAKAVDPGTKPVPCLDVPADQWDDLLRVYADNGATVGVVRPDFSVLEAVGGDVVPPANAEDDPPAGPAAEQVEDADVPDDDGDAEGEGSEDDGDER